MSEISEQFGEFFPVIQKNAVAIRAAQSDYNETLLKAERALTETLVVLLGAIERGCASGIHLKQNSIDGDYGFLFYGEHEVNRLQQRINSLRAVFELDLSVTF